MHALSYAWSLRLCDKDGSHTIRSGIAENPMLHTDLMALCFREPELWPIKVLCCMNWDFRPFCSCDLEIDFVTFLYELDTYSLET